MKEKILKFLKNYTKKENIYIMFLSYLLAFCMFSYINEFVYNVLPEVEITISSYETEKNTRTEKNLNYITLLENETTTKFYRLKNIFDKNKNLKENINSIKFINRGEYGYNLNALYLENINNKITFKVKKMPNVSLMIYNIGTSKKILIKSRKNFQVLDISGYNEGEIVNYFPFKESKALFIYTLISYLILGIIFFCVLNLLGFIIKNDKIKKFSKNKCLIDYNPKKMITLIYILISVYISLKFFTNTFPKRLFLEDGSLFGDQNYYWEMGKLLKNGNFKQISKNILNFRGYVTFILPGTAQFIAKFLKINALWLFYMLNNIWIALLLGYIIPELYSILSDKKAKNYQIFFLFLIFSIFWKGMYYAVLVDLLGVVFLLYSLLLFLKYKKNKKKLTAFFSGICIAISSLNRGSYVLGIYFIFLLFIINNMLFFIKKRNMSIKNSFFIYFFMGIILICLPQAKINYEKGKISLFSYDDKGSWTQKDESLKDEIIDGTLTNTFSGYPYSLSDATAQKIKKTFVGNIGNKISFKQALSAFILNPIDTIVMMSKKLLLALNTKTSEAYPDYPVVLLLHSDVYLFTLLNFFLISTVFYFVINKKLRELLFSKKEIITGSILFILFMIPQLLFHVEWRYYILLYLMIYYIFSFKFLDYLSNRRLKKTEYFKTILIVIFVLFIINSFYYDIF